MCQSTLKHENAFLVRDRTADLEKSSSKNGYNDLKELIAMFSSKTSFLIRFRLPQRFEYCTNNYNKSNISRVLDRNTQLAKCCSCRLDGHFSQNYRQKLSKIKHARSVSVKPIDFLHGNSASEDHL